MLRLASDEDFRSDIVRGLRRRFPDLDLVRVQDAGLSGATDPQILEWAAAQHRVLLTHDRQTLIRHAWDRVRASLPMWGVAAVPQWLPNGLAIEALELLAVASLDDEWQDQVLFIR